MKPIIYKALGILVGLFTIYVAMINFEHAFDGPLTFLMYIALVVFLACISYLLLTHN
jgi:uncharacterized membrane protein HdeD (DUF308 family)